MVTYFILFDAGGVGSDHLMEIIETLDSSKLIITDFNFQEIDVMGGMFTFNCTDELACVCILEDIAVAPTNWGSIKSLY